MDKVRRYAESLETVVAKVEEERQALLDRTKEIMQLEIAAVKMQAAVNLAEQKRAGSTAIEEANQQTRVIELALLVSKAETAQAVAKAKAADVSKNEVLDMLEPSKNDAAMKRVAEVRVAALSKDVDSAKLELNAKLDAERAVSVAALGEAEVRIKTNTTVVEASKAEILARIEQSSAEAVAAKATARRVLHAFRIQVADTNALQDELESRAPAVAAEGAARLEAAVNELSANVQAVEMEAVANTATFQAIADATLEGEKAKAAAKEEAAAAEAATRTDSATEESMANLEAAKADADAKLDAGRRTLTAEKEAQAAMLRADKMEFTVMNAESDAVAAVLAASKGWQRVAAENKATEARKNTAIMKEEAESVRQAATNRLEQTLAQVAVGLEKALGGTQVRLQQNIADISSRRDKILLKVAKRLHVATTEAVTRMDTAILEAKATKDKTVNSIRATRTAAAEASAARRDEAIVAAQATRAAAVKAAEMKREAAINAADANLDQAMLVPTTTSTVANDAMSKLATIEQTAHDAVAAADAYIAVTAAAREAAIDRGEVACAEASNDLSAIRTTTAARLDEAISKSLKITQEADKMRTSASTEADAVSASVSTNAERVRAAKKAVDEAKAAKDAAEVAKKAVAQAESDHAKAKSRATSTLERELHMLGTGHREAAEQLETLKADLRRLEALEQAAAEADAARKEANKRRATAEVERRKAEESRMTVQKESIKRRPGGRAFFEALHATS